MKSQSKLIDVESDQASSSGVYVASKNLRLQFENAVRIRKRKMQENSTTSSLNSYFVIFCLYLPKIFIFLLSSIIY